MTRPTMRRRGIGVGLLCATILVCMQIGQLGSRDASDDGRRGSGFGFGVAAQSINFNCTQAAPLTTGNRTVHLAMLFWGPPANDTQFTNDDGSVRIVWPRNPMLDGWIGPSSRSIRFMRAFLLWEERMELPAAYGGGPGLLMLDGSVMRFNLTWFNVGEFGSVRGPGEFTPMYQNSSANKLITQLADPNGPYDRQHFMVAPTVVNTQVTILASLACEASGTCMVISPDAAESRMFICQDPMPQDCVQRGRRKGSRRFENTVSAYSNADYWASGSMSLVVNKGIKRIFAIGETWSVGAMTQMSATAKLLGMRMVGTLVVDALTTDWRDYNTSSADLTQQIKDLDVDMVVILHTFEGTTVFPDLIYYWRSIGFLPKVVAYHTGGAAYLPPDLAAYFLVEVLWLPTLTGAQYRAVSSDTNFEIFPANATHDSPAVFADAFVSRFDYRPSAVIFSGSARIFHVMTIVQKLLELAQTEDTESLKQAAARIAAPGVYHAVQFDQWGRSMPFENYVLQLLPDGSTRVLTPLGLGSPAVLPIPGWSEREYNPVFLDDTSERVAFALTVVTVVYLLGWLVWVVSHRHHPLIRVADPLFYAFSICGGISVACACFFSTSLHSDATCAIFEWLFILGMTLGIAPLVLKNLRIWSMWNNRASFAPAPIKQWHTVCALVGLLLIDVALLTAWQVTGIRAYRVRPDPYRPALDYTTCDVYSHSRGFVIGAMSWKLLLFACAMYLAYRLRNVSPKYSESRFIAISVYNATLVLSVFVPVSATDAAGRDTPLIRVYLLLFLCFSTSSILFVPRLLAIRRSGHSQPEVANSVTGTRAAPEESLERSQESRPSQSAQKEQQQPHQPAMEPDNHAGSVAMVHIAAPTSTTAPVVVHGIVPWPAAASSPAVVVGLSQIGQRIGEGDLEANRSHADHSEPHPETRWPRREATRDAVSSPVPLLPFIPPSQGIISVASSSGVSESPSMSLLRSTVQLVTELPSEEVHELYSSLVRRKRRSMTRTLEPSADHSSARALLSPSPSVGLSPLPSPSLELGELPL